TGLCPFHDERTPSFSVSPEKGTYYCFGCQRGGDAISFVEETEGVDFVGAIEWLAQRFNIPLEYEQASPEQDARRRHRERLYAVLDAAAAFYERYLWESQAGAEARAYLEGRGLAEEVCREYRLGLAARGATLARKAGERGFTRQELTGAGLLNRRSNDYFQGRLLFPIADARARVVGFQARRLREDDPLQAKYVNSPEGELFRKGDLLYGLDRARTAIARARARRRRRRAPGAAAGCAQRPAARGSSALCRVRPGVRTARRRRGLRAGAREVRGRCAATRGARWRPGESANRPRTSRAT